MTGAPGSDSKTHLYFAGRKLWSKCPAQVEGVTELLQAGSTIQVPSESLLHFTNAHSDSWAPLWFAELICGIGD